MERIGPGPPPEAFCVRPVGKAPRMRGRRAAAGGAGRRFKSPEHVMPMGPRIPLGLRGALHLPGSGPSMPSPMIDHLPPPPGMPQPPLIPTGAGGVHPHLHPHFQPPPMPQHHPNAGVGAGPPHLHPHPPPGSAHLPSSPMPLPPMQYASVYTDENFRRNRWPRPPNPPGLDESYCMFGTGYHVDDAIVRPLEFQNIRRLYPQNFDHKKELKKLNCSVLVNFLDLLDLLIRSPEAQKRKEKIEDTTLLFVHMHHLVNEFRPHQAREALRVMLTQQKEQRLNIASSFDRHLEGVIEILRQTLSGLPSSTSSLADNRRLMAVLTESTGRGEAAAEQKNASGVCFPHDKMMCDFVDGFQS